MSVDARTMLDRLRAERAEQQPMPPTEASPAPAEQNTARARLTELRTAKAQRDRGFGGLVRSFNKGVIDLLAAPADLWNLAGSYGPVIGGDRGNYSPMGDWIRGAAEKLGQTAPPGQEAEGVLARGAEILGGSAIPVGGVMSHGRRVLAAGTPSVQRTAFQELAATTAARPGATVVGETVASVTAAAGGEVARQFSDDPAVIAMGELAGGLTPAGIVSGPQARLLRRGVEADRSALAPFTEAGATPRAARALQSRAADPEAAAAAIGAHSELSAARQTGDKRLLALERAVLEEDPALDAAFNDNLGAAVQRARDEARAFGGDVDRPRELLRRGRDYLVNLVNVRAAQASRAVSEALAKLDPNASPREISRAAREQVDQAHRTARATESQLWDAIDATAPASLTSARAALAQELGARSQWDDPSDIPAWLREALDESSGVPPELMDGLRSAGLVGDDGAIPAGIRNALEQGDGLKPQALTFNDVHALRKRVRRIIQEERAATVPNRNRIRILSALEDGLLADMAATNVEGVQAARAFSRALNERFTQGAVGRLLGYERRGGQATSPADTLSQVLSGRTSATKLQAFLRASPEAATQVEQFVKASFLAQTMDGDHVNLRAFDRFMRKWRDRGVFDAFPGLERDLTSVNSLAQASRRWELRASSVERLAHHGQKSRAALYLDAAPGEEMATLLRSRNPTAAAHTLVRRMRGDQAAVQGLKTAFVEELFRASSSARFTPTGDVVVSGARFTKLLKDYHRTATAFGMTAAERARLDRIAKTLRLAELEPGRAPGAIVDDTPSFVLDLLARWIGAQSGQRLAGSGMGSSLVMAQGFSKRMRDLLGRLTRDRAREIVVAAHSDPELYKALLTRSTASPTKQAAAARRLHAWTVGVAVPGEPAERAGDRAVAADAAGAESRAPGDPSSVARPDWAGPEIPPEVFGDTQLDPGYEYDVEIDGRRTTIRAAPDGRVYEVQGERTGRARPEAPRLPRALNAAARRARAAFDEQRDVAKRDLRELAGHDDATLARAGLAPSAISQVRSQAAIEATLVDARKRSTSNPSRNFGDYGVMGS